MNLYGALWVTMCILMHKSNLLRLWMDNSSSKQLHGISNSHLHKSWFHYEKKRKICVALLNRMRQFLLLQLQNTFSINKTKVLLENKSFLDSHSWKSFQNPEIIRSILLKNHSTFQHQHHDRSQVLIHSQNNWHTWLVLSYSQCCKR